MDGCQGHRTLIHIDARFMTCHLLSSASSMSRPFPFRSLLQAATASSIAAVPAALDRRAYFAWGSTELLYNSPLTRQRHSLKHMTQKPSHAEDE